LEPVEVHVDRTDILARSGELRPVALRAADVDRDQLSARRIGRRLEPPLAGRRDRRHAVEIGDQIGDLGVADLARDEGRHDAPRLAYRLGELRDGELAAGEIGPERTLAIVAVAIAALCSRAVPERLAGLGVALRQSRPVSK